MSPRALLQHARGQQQEHEHHRRVVPDVRAAAHGLDHAGEVGQQRRAGDQRVHAQPRAGAARATRRRGRASRRRTPPASTPGSVIQRKKSRVGQRHRRVEVQVQRLGQHHRLHRAEPGDAEAQQVAVAVASACILGGRRRWPARARIPAPPGAARCATTGVCAGSHATRMRPVTALAETDARPARGAGRGRSATRRRRSACRRSAA